MRKTPRGWIQIGESRTRGVARIPLGLKPSRDSRATSQRDSPIWIQPLGVFRYTIPGTVIHSGACVGSWFFARKPGSGSRDTTSWRWVFPLANTHLPGAILNACRYERRLAEANANRNKHLSVRHFRGMTSSEDSPSSSLWDVNGGLINRSSTRQNFELVHIIGPVQNFRPPARNFGPLRAEFAWREWRKTLGGHVANWAGLSGFSPRENKISHTFFIDCINKYSKVSNAHNSDDCHGVFNDGMLNKGWSFSRSRFDCLSLMHFFHG